MFIPFSSFFMSSQVYSSLDFALPCQMIRGKPWGHDMTRKQCCQAPDGNINTLLPHLLHCSFQSCIPNIAPRSGNVADDVNFDAFLAHGAETLYAKQRRRLGEQTAEQLALDKTGICRNTTNGISRNSWEQPAMPAFQSLLLAS